MVLRDRTGKWWKYLSIQYRWLPSYWWKSRKGALHSVSGSDSCSNLCSDPWKVHFGRRVYAIGTNRLTAYYSGIHVKKIRFIIYTVMGTFCGLCALFLVASSYGANTTTGNGFEMDAIAMAVFGGISSTGGKVIWQAV